MMAEEKYDSRPEDGVYAHGKYIYLLNVIYLFIVLNIFNLTF